MHAVKNSLVELVYLIFLLLIFNNPFVGAQTTIDSLTERSISLSEFRDKIKAGWIGQMAGVGWGAPTEFGYNGRIIPEDKVPEWKPEMVNVFGQDDLYVEMTFLQTMLDHGINVDIKQAGIDFANSSYMLWVANRVGRDNLRKGIAPPNSGHPAYNSNADAIDYQIEADYSGLISPGLPNQAVELGETFGRLMNYGDGLYGGQFVGAMYSEAFFETDPRKIVEKGLQYIPAESQYAEAIRDVLQWHSENPSDWVKTWELINEKYHKNPAYRKFTSDLMGGEQNIDAKLNGAYIVMGLLYGEGDPDQTIIISMRCGQDSDCNPSNAAGILFTAMGINKVPQRFLSELDEETTFSFTEFTFPGILEANEKLAFQIIERAGGRIEKDQSGEEILVLPVEEPRPGILEQSWQPQEPKQVNFTKEELSQIKGSSIFNWSLLIIFFITLFVFNRNRSPGVFSIAIPFLLLYGLLEYLKSAIHPDLLSTVNIIVMLQSLATAIAVLLLIFSTEIPNRFLKIGISMLVLLVIGIIGAIGASDGRYIAATKVSLIGTYLLSFVWFFALLGAVELVRKKYKRWTFNVVFLGSLFIVQIAGFYILSMILANISGPWTDMVSNFGFVLTGAFTLAVFLYFVSLPYLIFIRYQSDYGNRYRKIINVT